MKLEELQNLMDARSEDEHLEFKEAKSRFDFEKLVGYCVALANEGGGKIILGVSDQPPRRVVGTLAFEVPERTVAGIYERLHLKVVFQEVQHADGRVLVFDVPSRPVGQPIEYEGRYYMRAGEELGGMTLAQFEESISVLDTVQDEINALLTQLDAKRTERTIEEARVRDVLDLVASSIKASPEHGRDSILYSSFGFIRQSDRKSGLHRLPAVVPVVTP